MRSAGDSPIIAVIRCQAMKTWRVIVQSVGVANLLLTIYGWYLWAVVALDIHRRPSAGEAAYFRAAFWTLSSISAAFLVAFVVVSVMLLRLRPRAAMAHTILFLVLIVYAFSPGSLWLLPNGVGHGIAAASGIGSMAVGPLLFFPALIFHSFTVWFGYPVISMLLVNFAWHRMKRISSGATLAVKNA